MIVTQETAHREFGYLPMKDGIRLAYVVWRPLRESRCPTIVNYSTYGQSGTPFKDVQRFLEAGYAYVGANVRGTGASEGSYSYYQPIEGPDGVELIEWAAAQAWSTGDVGMVGASYGAHTQLKVAALHPPSLRAIVPIATEGSEYRDEGMSGGLFNAALLAHWTFVEQPDLARAGAEARLTGGDADCAAIRVAQLPNPAYAEVQQHPFYDDWWRSRALDEMAEQITVPTLFIHGWQDEWIRPNGAIRLFTLLRSTQKKLVLQNGPHRLTRYHMNQKEQMRWLDRWVKGERNEADADAAVKVFWEVTDSESSDNVAAEPAWITTYSAWPPPSLEWITLYLTATGELSPDIPGMPEGHGARRYIYPLGTELIGTSEQFALRPHPLGSLSYRTLPMTVDTALLGSPQLTIFFSSDQVDTDFMFTLKDIDPSGNTLFLQRSVLRASLRAVDRQRSSSGEIIQSYERSNNLVPGEIYEATLSISALGHIVREGHRLELSILAPSSIPNPVWGFVLTSKPSINRIFHSEMYPSNLRLPVVPGERALKPAPSLGSLKNQPFRRPESSRQIDSRSNSREAFVTD